MAKNPSLSIQVHLDDETEIEASRVPSEQRDFVSLKLGWQVSALLFTPAQAMALAQAAIAAHRILVTIACDIEEAEMTKAWSGYEGYGYEGEEVYEYEDDDDRYECTDNNPCSLCRSY